MKAQDPPLPASQHDDPDIRAIPAAMERARREAHRVAHWHGTGVLEVRDGKMIEVAPDPALYQRKD